MKSNRLKFYSFKESAIKSTDIDYTLYKSKQLSPDYRIHWRILKEAKEIELVMVVNGTSWAGLGWRPRQLTASCRNFPDIREFGVPETVAEPEPEPTSEPAAEPEPTSEPEPASEPKSPISSKTKRVADDTTSKQGITVATSVSYRVSAKTGRRRRDATTESEYNERSKSITFTS